MDFFRGKHPLNRWVLWISKSTLVRLVGWLIGIVGMVWYGCLVWLLYIGDEKKTTQV